MITLDKIVRTGIVLGGIALATAGFSGNAKAGEVIQGVDIYDNTQKNYFDTGSGTAYDPNNGKVYLKRNGVIIDPDTLQPVMKEQTPFRSYPRNTEKPVSETNEYEQRLEACGTNAECYIDLAKELYKSDKEKAIQTLETATDMIEKGEMKVNNENKELIFFYLANAYNNTCYKEKSLKIFKY